MAEGIASRKPNYIMAGELNLMQKGPLKKMKAYYAQLWPKSQSGVARLEVYQNMNHSLSYEPLFTLLGTDAIKVESIVIKGDKKAFLISTKTEHYKFSARGVGRGDLLCNEWVKNIQQTFFGKTTIREVVKECELYESCDEVSPQSTEFIVRIDEGTQEKIHTKGNVKLSVKNGSIIISHLHGKNIVEWPLKSLRRFGRVGNGTLMVEVGRKITLGDGTYYFITEQGASIMKAIERGKNAHEEDNKQIHSLHSNSIPAVQQPKLPNVKLNDCEYASSHYEDFYIPSAMMTSLDIQKKVQHQVPPPTSDVPITNNQQQEQTYDEPQLITDAWKSNGCNEDMEDIYSALQFSPSNSPKILSPSQKNSHFWQESRLNKGEPIYAEVDISKKKKKMLQ